MTQPTGFEDPEIAGKVCKLLESIYGLKQASRSWNKRFDKETKKQNEDFVVELLIDASGSQQKRQNFVALQSFVVSNALSKVLWVSERISPQS